MVGASRDDAQHRWRLPRPLVEADRPPDVRLHLRPVLITGTDLGVAPV
jgi:hypothetical protein